MAGDIREKLPNGAGDESDHRLFVVTRYPPRLLAFDTESGRTVATLPVVQDADDVYYDAERKRIYVPGGEGYVSVFQQRDADHYELLAKIPTRLAHAPRATSANWGRRDLIVSIWPCPRAQAARLKSKFTRYKSKTEDETTKRCTAGTLHRAAQPRFDPEVPNLLPPLTPSSSGRSARKAGCDRQPRQTVFLNVCCSPRTE